MLCFVFYQFPSSVVNFLFSYTKFIIDDPYTEVFEVVVIYQFHILNSQDGFRIGNIAAFIPIPDPCVGNVYFESCFLEHLVGDVDSSDNISLISTMYTCVDTPTSSSIHWPWQGKQDCYLLIVNSFGMQCGILKGSVPISSSVPDDVPAPKNMNIPDQESATGIGQPALKDRCAQKRLAVHYVCTYVFIYVQ